MKTGRFGLFAAGAMVAAVAALATVGSAGATGQQAAATVYASEEGGQCFSTAAAPHACGTAPLVEITTGQTVDFAFPGVPPSPTNPDGNYAAPHNAASDSDNWDWTSGDPVSPPQATATTPAFNQAGDYTFICQVHPGMSGTIRVTGDPVGTPTPPPTVTPTPTASTQPSDPGTTTPNPGGQTDAVKPTVSAVKLKALKRGAQVKFTLSEDATVTIDVKRARKLVKRKSLQATAGTRTVKVSSPKLKKGSYTIEVRARDAFGNRSTLAKKSLRIRR